MKISFEIKNDKFFYSWDIGTENQAGEMPMHSQALICFTKTLEFIRKAFDYGENKRQEELLGRIWVEKNKSKEETKE